ncbi:collagen alpha-1(I) chain-like [Budorcas taxicolor]|uniref:collagen alpha-1(I) chain-like n=1 Tax=Budorcas taxicolor TaxID=37181 RepID=UPI00228450C3|nr:collagen alpha-1(I) chain-like [Budorcas taxicolor]
MAGRMGGPPLPDTTFRNLEDLCAEGRVGAMEEPPGSLWVLDARARVWARACGTKPLPPERQGTAPAYCMASRSLRGSLWVRDGGPQRVRYPNALLTPVHRARGHGECGEAADCARALTREPRARREAGAAVLRGWGGRPGRGRDGRGGQAAGGAGALSRPLGAARRPPPPPPPHPGARRPGRSWRRPRGANSPPGPAPEVEARARRAGQGARMPRGVACTLPLVRPRRGRLLPGPEAARPQAPSCLRTRLAGTLRARDAAGLARCGPSASDVRESAEGLGRKSPQSLPLAPISRTRPPRPERGRSLWERGGDKLPSPGSEAANSALEPPRRARRQSRRSRAPPWRIPAGLALGLPPPGFRDSQAGPPPPRSRRNKSESSAEQERASREEGRAGLGAPGSRHAQRSPRGTRRGRRAVRTDRRTWRHPGVRTQSFAATCGGEGGSLPRPPSLPRRRRGSRRNRRLQTLGDAMAAASDPKYTREPPHPAAVHGLGAASSDKPSRPPSFAAIFSSAVPSRSRPEARCALPRGPRGLAGEGGRPGPEHQPAREGAGARLVPRGSCAAADEDRRPRPAGNGDRGVPGARPRCFSRRGRRDDPKFGSAYPRGLSERVEKIRMERGHKGNAFPSRPWLCACDGEGSLPQPGLPPRPGCGCVDSGEPSSAEEPLPRPGRPLLNPPGAGARRPARFRRRRRRRQGAGAGGGVRARSANLGATKPQTAKLGSPGVRPSPDPLPPSLRPLSPRPQSPAPRQSLPYLPRQQRPRWRRLDRASCKSPGAPRVAGGRAGRPTGAGAPPAAATPGPFQA